MGINVTTAADTFDIILWNTWVRITVIIAASNGFFTMDKNQSTLKYVLRVFTAPESIKTYPIDNVTPKRKMVLKFIFTTFSHVAQPIPGKVIMAAPNKAGILGCMPCKGSLSQRPTIINNIIKQCHSRLFTLPNSSNFTFISSCNLGKDCSSFGNGNNKINNIQMAGIRISLSRNVYRNH